jgi:hypothetical protein
LKTFEKTFEQIAFERIETEATRLLNELIARRPRRGRPIQGQSPADYQGSAIALLERCASQGIAPPESLVSLFRFLLPGTRSNSGAARLTERQRKAVEIDARYIVKTNRRVPAQVLAREAGVSRRTVYEWLRLPAYQKEVQARVSSHLTKRLRKRDCPTEATNVSRVDPLVKLRAEATRHWEGQFRSPLGLVSSESKLFSSPEEWAQYMLDHELQFAPEDYILRLQAMTISVGDDGTSEPETSSTRVEQGL